MRSPSSKKAVVLFDLGSTPPENHDYSDLWKDDSFNSERLAFRTLESLGYEPQHIAVYNDLPRLISELKAANPQIVFNMAEAFNNRRDQSAQIAACLDLLGIPYTGTKWLGLGICQDKNLSKKILSHHRIRVPRWIVSLKKRPLKKLPKFKFPAFVKPTSEEASEGISQDSFVENETDCLDRIHFLHQKFESDVLIEEFIPGREFYVSVIGRKRLQVLPIRELTMKEFPEDRPKFATYKVKWDEEYRKKYSIKNEFAKGLTDEQVETINSIVKRAFEALHLEGYARFDLRMTDKGTVYLLEANPNPSLNTWDDFMLSAQKTGLLAEDVIQKIVDLAY